MSEKRLIRAFSNSNDQLLWELVIADFDLPAFQAAFDLEDPENPMYDCWEIKPEHLPFLAPYVENPHRWNFSTESYFLECDAE